MDMANKRSLLVIRAGDVWDFIALIWRVNLYSII